MRLLSAWMLAAALTPTGAKKKKRRPKTLDTRTEQQRSCDACMALAAHARNVVNTVIQAPPAHTLAGPPAERDRERVRGSVVDWPAVLREGCPAEECGTLLRGVSQAIAEELVNLVEDGDVIDARVLPDLLCAPSSVTGACRTYDPPDATPRTSFVVALHNERTVDEATRGAIEVHLVAPADLHTPCAPSEGIRNETKRLAQKSVRKLHAGEEQLFVLSIHSLQPTLPTLRIKPLNAPCGAGRDLDVDLLDDRWAVYRVRDSAKAATLPGGIHRPLGVGRLAGRDARDKLPTGHPFHGEL